MSFFGLFSSARALRVTDAGVSAVSDGHRVHAQHQFQRTWTVAAGTNVQESHRLTKLSLKTPGLTIARLCPDLGGDTVARIRASSDASHHLDRLTLAIKHKSELRVKLEKTNESPPPLGVLIVEIELAHPSLLKELKASGSGDVVVDYGGVFAHGDDARLSIAARNHSRVFVQHPELTTFKRLRLASVSGGSIFFSSPQPLVAHELSCQVFGDGRVAITAPRVDTRELGATVVGDHGAVHILAPDGFAITKAETVVFGGGSILVQSSPLHERHASSIADRVSADVVGAGCVDVGALASREVHVTAKDGGRAVVRSRERLATVECDAMSTVECIGGWPLHVDAAATELPPNRLLVLAYEDRVWTASESLPVVPTLLDAWATPKTLQVQKAGIRETLRPLGSVQFQVGVTVSSSSRSGVQVGVTTPSRSMSWDLRFNHRTRREVPPAAVPVVGKTVH